MRRSTTRNPTRRTTGSMDGVEGALRSLDAAEDRTDSDSPRALRDLQRILATDSSSVPLHRPAPAGQAVGRSRTRRLAPSAALAAALAVAVSAAVTAGVLALPSLSGGDQAFASWTPTPAALPTTDRAEAAADCREAQDEDAYAAQLSAAETVIAERRGVWTTVVLAGEDGFTVLCITDESRPYYDRGMIGHIGTLDGFALLAPRGLLASSLGHGTVDGGDLSLAAGSAGSDITGITYRSRTHGEVTATLSRGHFALWLPGRELEDASSAGVELQVAYRDGTTGTQLLTM